MWRSKVYPRSRTNSHKMPCCGWLPPRLGRRWLKTSNWDVFTVKNVGCGGMCAIYDLDLHPFMSFTHHSINLYLCITSIASAILRTSQSIQELDIATIMTSPTSSPALPTPAHIPAAKPPGYAEATELEAQDTDSDTSPPCYSPPRPSAPWPGQSQGALIHVERNVRRARLDKERNRTLACFILLAFLLVAIFIVVVIIEVVGHLDE